MEDKWKCNCGAETHGNYCWRCGSPKFMSIVQNKLDGQNKKEISEENNVVSTEAASDAVKNETAMKNEDVSYNEMTVNDIKETAETVAKDINTVQTVSFENNTEFCDTDTESISPDNETDKSESVLYDNIQTEQDVNTEIHQNAVDFDKQNFDKVTCNAPQKKGGNGIFALSAVLCGLAVIVAVIALVATIVTSNSSMARYTKVEQEVSSLQETAEADKEAAAEFIDGKVTLTDVSTVVNEAMPSVVSITSRTIVNNYGFDWFFGNRGQSSSEEVESGIGSGTIIKKDSENVYILTSYHVVEDCSSLYVTFNDDTSVDGTIWSASEEKDIAIVAVPVSDISEETLDAISIAKLNKNELTVGQGIIVIGDALGYGQSVTTGVVSALNRELDINNEAMSLIQTDAAINAGNSGGCMLDTNGNVVGISEAKITVTSVEGMCYAIPIADNYDLIEELVATSNYTEEDNDSQQNEYGIMYGNNGGMSIF